jgi:hypothetical protein
MAYGYAREGKWRGNWRMEWVASTLHTTSELGVSSITTADAHTSAASSRLNWCLRRFKWIRPFRRKTKSGFCVCDITFQTQSAYAPVNNTGSTFRDRGYNSYLPFCPSRTSQVHTSSTKTLRLPRTPRWQYLVSVVQWKSYWWKPQLEMQFVQFTHEGSMRFILAQNNTWKQKTVH